MPGARAGGVQAWMPAPGTGGAQAWMPGPVGCTSSGVPGCVTQGGGPGARGWDHRVGGRSAFQPRAPATLVKGAGGRGDSFPRPPPSLLHSPSSLPTGWAADTASHRRHALSRSKRSPSGSRPSGSSELRYGWSPPLSVACTVPNAGYSIFPANPNPPIEPRPREMWPDG